MSVAPSRRRFLPTTADTTVSPLKLYFDLVFVFALTQVTAMMADDLTPRGVLRGMLVLALLWWSWVGYAWLCNLVRTDSGPIRMVLFLAMTAMFVLALGIPEAFDDRPGGLPGPIVVALCYFAFRFMHLTIFWLISADDPVLRRQII
ncbi:MAG: low temperature requirement protein A, partial [Nocardioidaceae bacterium]|nr:low temperature requirement protein A [Nocardioidaceae bacterium]